MAWIYLRVVATISRALAANIAAAHRFACSPVLSSSLPPAHAPSAMPMLNTPTYSAVATSTACGTAFIIQLIRPTETPP
ncbi:hypothetical protein G6F46_015816 [Rhizopus delemar]|nr:hypothetical protein G6F60_015745 [Rhizopus arrhizus]KAG1578029.1 hypothetical protein G6F46_015816 [Rhizopus delemar]